MADDDHALLLCGLLAAHTDLGVLLHASPAAAGKELQRRLLSHSLLGMRVHSRSDRATLSAIAVSTSWLAALGRCVRSCLRAEQHVLPRYYFDTADNGRSVRDDVGVELPDDDSARRHVAEILPDLAHRGLPDGDLHTFDCTARNEAGEDVYHAKITYRGSLVARR